jgi:hypothetical protein
MATSALVLMSLLSNHSLMSNMFDIDYLKAQEKNRLSQFKKDQRNRRASLTREYKALMLTSKLQHKHKHNLNDFKYYLNYNIKR